MKNVTWGVLWAPLTTEFPPIHWFLQQAGKEWLLSILFIQQILTEWHFLPGTVLEAGNAELVWKFRLGDGYAMGEIRMWLTGRRKRCPYQPINLYFVSSPETIEKSMWNIGRGYVWGTEQGLRRYGGEEIGSKSPMRRFGITQGENALLFQTERNQIGYKHFYNLGGGKACLWSPIIALILGIKLESRYPC